MPRKKDNNSQIAHERRQRLIARWQRMRHCVYSYGRSIQNGDCSIWSLIYKKEDSEFSHLTIEVRSRDKCIVQARGPCNRRPTDKERMLMSKWASHAGLTVLHK